MKLLTSRCIVQLGSLTTKVKKTKMDFQQSPY